MEFSKEELLSFLDAAGKATYAGGGAYEKAPERPGFHELTCQNGDFSYRDSYTGFIRSWGTEVVRYKNKPVWTSLYGGGMVEGEENIANECFTFLKKVLSTREEGFFSVRGPRLLEDGDWKHTYKQDGNYDNFSGYQEIFYKGELVFFHHAIGGLVVEK